MCPGEPPRNLSPGLMNQIFGWDDLPGDPAPRPGQDQAGSSGIIEIGNLDPMKTRRQPDGSRLRPRRTEAVIVDQQRAIEPQLRLAARGEIEAIPARRVDLQ